MGQLALAAVLAYAALIAALSGWALWSRQWEQASCELTYMHPSFKKVL